MNTQLMEIAVPVEQSFDCPEGNHKATFYQVRHVEKQKEGRVESYIRLLFKVDDLSNENQIVLVGRNFIPSLEAASDLRIFIDSWLGKDYIEKHKAANGAFMMRSLENLPALIVVNHIENEGYAMPYVYLVAAYPPGTEIMEQNIYKRRKHAHN